MNPLVRYALRRLRKLDARRHPQDHQRVPPEADLHGAQVNAHIKALLLGDRPFLLCRMGGTELPVMVAHLDISDRTSVLQKSMDYIQGRRGHLWWEPKTMAAAYNFSGIFPPTPELLTRYSIDRLAELKEIDLLGSWLAEEKRIASYFPSTMRRAPVDDLEPFRYPDPWSEALRGRKVLVIHPFEESIRAQYAKRELLFANPAMLPAFDLIAMKSVQSLVGNQVEFPDWFAALDSMVRKMEAIDFDVLIVGAGAYGFPLAVHAKRMGKKAIHLGGVTQLLFGIRGKRWDEDYPEYKTLFNEHWIRPLAHETPQQFKLLEAGAYW